MQGLALVDKDHTALLKHPMRLRHRIMRDALNDSTFVAAVTFFFGALTAKSHNNQKQHHTQN